MMSLIVVASAVGVIIIGGVGIWIAGSKSGKKAEQNKQMKIEVKDALETNKRRNDIMDNNVSDIRKRLRKYTRDQ